MATQELIHTNWTDNTGKFTICGKPIGSVIRDMDDRKATCPVCVDFNREINESLTKEVDNMGVITNPSDKKKPFAILWLTTLRLAKFNHKQEFKDAILTLQNNGTEFIALIYHKDADIYTVPEVI